MFRHLLPLILGVLVLSAAGARAGDAQPDIIPLQASLVPEPVQLADPVYRAYVQAGSNQFAFLVPNGFWLRGDPAQGRLMLDNKEGNCTITFAVIDSRPAADLGTDYYRELVLKRHPSGTIVQESGGSAAGASGPAFDVQWKTGGDLVQIQRVIFIPTSAGVLEFTATTTRSNFAGLQNHLNLVLMTFRYSTKGRLEIVHIANKL
jgi:hypothetical protein